jgi:hypothetical protein
LLIEFIEEKTREPRHTEQYKGWNIGNAWDKSLSNNKQRGAATGFVVQACEASDKVREKWTEAVVRRYSATDGEPEQKRQRTDETDNTDEEDE